MPVVISLGAGAIALCLSLVSIDCFSAPTGRDVQASVRAAQSTLAAVQNDPGMTSFRDSIKHAKAILIITPKQARAVALARNDGAQTWSGPAFYTITRVQAAGGRAGTLGFSAGEQDLELVAMAMTGKAADWLLAPTITGKTQLNIMPGSAGSTRGTVDLAVFDRSKAPGASTLEDTVVSVDKTANQQYYGKPVTPADILVRRSVSNSDAAPLQQAVAQAAR